MFPFPKVAPPILLMVTLLAPPVFAKDAPAPAAKDAAGAQATEKAKPAPTDVMVRVNGTTITRRELDRAVKVMLAQNPVPQTAENGANAQAVALDQLTAAELLYQAASKTEVKDLDKLVAAKVAQSRAKFASDADFENALKEVDMTPKDFQDFSRKDIIISTFVEERFAARATVSEDEAQTFYYENVYKFFKKPETARASHILIGVDEKATPEQRQNAKEKADAILQRVKNGEDFAGIAKAESSCPSKAQGGDLGTFNRGQMVPPFDAAVFAMNPGQVSEVVETQYGYHIIKVTERHEGTTEKYEDVKGKIVDFLKRESTQKALVTFIEDQKKLASIEKPAQI